MALRARDLCMRLMIEIYTALFDSRLANRKGKTLRHWIQPIAVLVGLVAGRAIRCDSLVPVMARLTLRVAANRNRAMRLSAVVTGLALYLAVTRMIEPAAPRFRLRRLLLQVNEAGSGRLHAHITSGRRGIRGRIVEDVSVAIEALRALDSEFVRDVTLRAVLHDSRREATVHRRNGVRGGVASRICAGRHCFTRRLLCMRIVAGATLGVMWIIRGELLGNALPHGMTAHALFCFG